jgi:benzoate membrane transport protein
MLVIYFVGRRFNSRYTIPFTLLGGLAWAGGNGLIHFEAVTLALAQPVFTMPTFSLSTIVGVGIPLFIVTMASQNVPGIAVLRANGYQTPVSPLIGWTGLTGLMLGPFGGYQFNLAAITAAICMSPEADRNPERRYLARYGRASSICHRLLGATVASVFTALPEGTGRRHRRHRPARHHRQQPDRRVARRWHERDAALLTFLVTASGLTLWGVGSAFWGLLKSRPG